MKEHKDWIVRYFSEHEDDEEDGIILNELIRCKDCKHYAILEDGSNELICDHKDGCLTPKPDGFCNYAEQKRKAKT